MSDVYVLGAGLVARFGTIAPSKLTRKVLMHKKIITRSTVHANSKNCNNGVDPRKILARVLNPQKSF